MYSNQMLIVYTKHIVNETSSITIVTTQSISLVLWHLKTTNNESYKDINILFAKIFTEYYF